MLVYTSCILCFLVYLVTIVSIFRYSLCLGVQNKSITNISALGFSVIWVLDVLVIVNHLWPRLLALFNFNPSMDR